MSRLLHLLGHEHDFRTEWGLRALVRRGRPDVGTELRSIGRGGTYPNLLRAVIGLRRAMRGFALVHAWDGRALAAAVLAGARRVVFDAPPDLRRAGGDRLRFLLRRVPGVRVVCSGAAQHNRLAALGVPPERLHVIRPAVDVTPAPVPRDAGLRRRLGISDDDFVLLAPGESTRPAAHERAVWTGSILHVTDERYRVLLWGRGPVAGEAAGLGRKLRQPGLVVVAERALGRAVGFEELLPAADAMLVTARGPVSPLPVALAMAAGLPVIAVDSPVVRELAATRPFTLTAPTDAPRLLAQCVLELRADASLRERLVADGRAAARELFSADRSAEQYRTLYASLAAGAAAAAASPRTAAGAAPGAGWNTLDVGNARLNPEDA